MFGGKFHIVPPNAAMLGIVMMTALNWDELVHGWSNAWIMFRQTRGRL
jgi:hypothetical protein